MSPIGSREERPRGGERVEMISLAKEEEVRNLLHSSVPRAC